MFRSLQESELVELRETIEMLKTQNTDAQTAIQVALNGPDHLHKGNAGSCWNALEARGVLSLRCTSVIGCIFTLIGPKRVADLYFCAAKIPFGKLKVLKK